MHERLPEAHLVRELLFVFACLNEAKPTTVPGSLATCECQQTRLKKTERFYWGQWRCRNAILLGLQICLQTQMQSGEL
jgi:hypothetical protein